MTSAAFNPRQDAILEYLVAHGTARPDELAQALGVSGATIRRDLAALHEARAIVRFHGGVAPLDDLVRRPFADRRAENAALKRRVARALAAEIPAGSALFLGTGTTMEQLARDLPGNRNLTVVTASLFTAAALVNRPGIDLHMLGGRAVGPEGNVSGAEPLRALESLRFDLAVVGFSGFDDDGRPMDLDLDHRAVKELAMAHSRRVICGVDHTKFHRRGLVYVGRLAQLDLVVTTAPPPAPAAAAMAEAGVAVRLAD